MARNDKDATKQYLDCLSSWFFKEPLHTLVEDELEDIKKLAIAHIRGFLFSDILSKEKEE